MHQCSYQKFTKQTLYFEKETNTQSSISINDEITNAKNTSEGISCNKNSEEVMDHACDDNGNIVLNIEEETDIESIQ